jgi:hypothetical protein
MQSTIYAEISQFKPKKLEKGKRVKESSLTSHVRAIKKDIAINNLQEGKVMYQHLSTHKNPTYEDGIKTIPFESCLIHNKCNRITSENGQKLRVRTEPKWLTDLSMWQKDENGVLGLTGVYSSNDFKASNHRKIKSLNRFCDKYQPLFEQRKCTLLFLTFTNANKCKPWVTMIKIIREYFKREGNPILDFVWTGEVSENLHWHYHLCIAIDRVKWKKIPERYKFENIWGQRTQIDFVKKNVKYYMSKYFAKSNYRIEGKRSYGISKIKK